MTSIERMAQTLARKPVDHTPIAVSPWGPTVARWRREGHLQPDEAVAQAVARAEEGLEREGEEPRSAAVAG